MALVAPRRGVGAGSPLIDHETVVGVDGAQIAGTPPPPYLAVVFTSLRRRPAVTEARTRSVKIRVAAGRSLHHPVGREPITLAASITSIRTGSHKPHSSGHRRRPTCRFGRPRGPISPSFGRADLCGCLVQRQLRRRVSPGGACDCRVSVPGQGTPSAGLATCGEEAAGPAWRARCGVGLNGRDFGLTTGYSGWQ